MHDVRLLSSVVERWSRKPKAESSILSEGKLVRAKCDVKIFARKEKSILSCVKEFHKGEWYRDKESFESGIWKTNH